MATVRIDNVDLYYEETGPPGGEPLVLIHGYSASSGMWAFQRGPFAERYRVITWDVRGHGRSQVTSGKPKNDLARFAQDLAELLDHLGIRRAHVLGLSMGGMIAIEFALGHPERVQTLMLCDTLAGRLALPLLGVFHLLPVTAMIGPLRNYLGMRFPGAGKLEGEVAEVARSMSSHADQRAMLRASRALAWKKDRVRALGRFRFPTLVVVGKEDVLYNASLVIYERVPKATLAILDRCGHGTAVLRSRTFNHVVLGFLEQAAAGSPPGGASFYPKTPRGTPVIAEPLPEVERARSYLSDSWRVTRLVAPQVKALVRGARRALLNRPRRASA